MNKRFDQALKAPKSLLKIKQSTRNQNESIKKIAECARQAIRDRDQSPPLSPIERSEERVRKSLTSHELNGITPNFR